MSDASVAEIARRLAKAMLVRAHNRQPADGKAVQLLQSELVAEIAAELDPIGNTIISEPGT